MTVVWLAVDASYAHASLALPLLHAASVAAGVRADWHVVRAMPRDSVGGTTAAVVGHRPDVVAASLYLFNRRFVLDVVRRVAALCPTCRIVLGGPECLGDNAVLLNAEPSVSAVFRGEAELGFPVWLAQFDNPDEWSRVPGLCWRDADGVCHDSERAIVPDFASVPAPHGSPFFDWSKPFVLLETARGCRGTCCFCTSCGATAIRATPLAQVRNELQRFRERGVREVRVLDRTFNAIPQRCADMLTMFRGEFPTIRFHVEFHPAFLPLAVRAALQAAEPGQLHIEAGLQTSAAMALRACNRTGSGAAVLEGLAFLCACRNLAVHVDLLAGLPELTTTDILNDLNTVMGLAPDTMQLEVVKVLPGTPLRRHAAALGIVFASTPPYEVLQTAAAGNRELDEIRLLSRWLDSFYNRPELRSTVRQAVARQPDFARDCLRYLRDRGQAEPRLSVENRFRCLHAYGRDRGQLPLCERLEREWLQWGLSPEHGIAPAARWRVPLPRDAACLQQDPESPLDPRDTVWHLVQSDSEYWFAYGHQGRGPAAAVYRRPRRDP